MRRFVALVLLAVFSMTSPAAKADGPISVYPTQAELAPTKPQVPSPQSEDGRVPTTPAQVTPGQPAGASNCQNKCCTNQKNCAQKFFAWITYRNTAGDALPLLKVHPYISPYVGTFGCTSSPGSACAGNCNSAYGKKEGCATSPARPVAEKAANPAANPAATGMGAMSVMPQFGQGYPGRGCQGGSAQMSDPSFPGSSRANPMNPDYIRIPETPAPIESVELKTIAATNNSDASGYQVDFVAAVLITRQVQTPLDLQTRPNSRP